MADEDRDLALVPGAAPPRWEVVLRDPLQQRVVLYNRATAALRTYSAAAGGAAPCEVCPTCGQAAQQQEQQQQQQQQQQLRPETRSDYFRVVGRAHRRDTGGAPPSSSSRAPEGGGGTAPYLNNGYYARFFREGRMLGRGGYGTVHVCEHVLNGVRLGTYAVKRVPVGESRPWLLKVLREVEALERVRHPNVVHYSHTWLEEYRAADFGPAVPCLFVLMEYANGGTVASQLWPNGARAFLPERRMWNLFTDTCLGLRHLHRLGIVHRDLKPENLLLASLPGPGADSPDQMHVLISDFGESTIGVAGAAARRPRSGATGTLLYCAPEVLLDSSRPAGTSSDLWSLGVVLYTMAFSELPFDEDTAEGLAARVAAGPVPYPARLAEQLGRHPGLAEILAGLLEPDPRRRWSLDRVLAHPAVRANDTEGRVGGGGGGGGVHQEASAAVVRRRPRPLLLAAAPAAAPPLPPAPESPKSPSLSPLSSPSAPPSPSSPRPARRRRACARDAGGAAAAVAAAAGYAALGSVPCVAAAAAASAAAREWPRAGVTLAAACAAWGVLTAPPAPALLCGALAVAGAAAATLGRRRGKKRKHTQ